MWSAGKTETNKDEDRTDPEEGPEMSLSDPVISEESIRCSAHPIIRPKIRPLQDAALFRIFTEPHAHTPLRPGIEGPRELQGTP